MLIGAAIRIGNISKLLLEIRDVFCIICNTIMTADTVCEMSKRPQPVIWILHEWWDDQMIADNLSIRNIESLTLDTVKQALCQASMIVFVCEAQRQLYKPTAPSTVIYVGVPSSMTAVTSHAVTNNNPTTTDNNKNNMDCPDLSSLSFHNKDLLLKKKTFTFLCLGIIKILNLINNVIKYII